MWYNITYQKRGGVTCDMKAGFLDRLVKEEA